MPFTGKATYSAGAELPELVDDVSDIISIVSPWETPLLDHLGDAQRPATSIVHEWMEDALLPNFSVIDDAKIGDPEGQQQFTVADGSRFRTGDQIQLESGREVMLVIGLSGNTIAVHRQYGGTPVTPLQDGATVKILGNAALEGDDAAAARFTTRSRVQNYTQIFTSSVEVSGSQVASKSHGLLDEVDFQKQNRLRELLRDLENCVINGVHNGDAPQGNESTRRTMRGLVPSIQANRFEPGVDGFPMGDDDDPAGLTETMLNAALRRIWEHSSARIDTIVCNGRQKRSINAFLSSGRRYEAADRRYQSLVDLYESDFGVCRVIMSRWMHSDSLLLLDSSRIQLVPLAGRSFSYQPLATTGDSTRGQLIGEYTLEMRNETAHGMLTGLSANAAA